MKIALYVGTWPPGSSANGIVTYASQLVPTLRRLGHEVFVLTFQKLADDDDPHTIDLRSFCSIPSLWDRTTWGVTPATRAFNASSHPIATAIRTLYEKHKFDVIEIEETVGWGLAISRLNLLPVVVRLHGPWFLTGSFSDSHSTKSLNRRRIKWEGCAIKRAQFVTAPSAAVLRTVNSHYNLDLKASQVIPNPLHAANDADIWDPKTCDVNTLLFVGRFDELKGGDLVLRVYAELAASYPRLRLTFVGPDWGIIQANGKKWSFEHFVRGSLPKSCWSRIQFFGPMSQSDVISLRRKHYMTIIPSRYEVFGYTVLEAMSLGCPIVATAVGGIPELIQDQRNGLLVASQDVKAMVAACKKLLDDRALAARLGRQAWKDCREFYTPHDIAKQTVAAYELAIDNFKRKRLTIF